MNQPHVLSRKVAGFSYCTHCGLIALANAETRKALQKGCAERAKIDAETKKKKKSID